MSDLIIEGAKGIPDGLYVIKDGELFKYKPKGGTVRSYHVTDTLHRRKWRKGRGMKTMVMCFISGIVAIIWYKILEKVGR